MARRILDFNELEAWLRELPWWREWVMDIGGAVTGSGDVTGVHRAGGKPGSPTEREALNLMRIRDKVDLLDAWVGDLWDDDLVVTSKGKPPKLPLELAKLIHLRYMAKTATMGLPVDACCQELHISRPTFWKRRQQALSLLNTAIYTSSIELGAPYVDCRDELVPAVARAGGLEAEIRKLERAAHANEQKAARAQGKNLDQAQAQALLGQADGWRRQAAVLREQLKEQ